ncbi:MAG: hypothetical protein ABIE22_02375 [archaeon]
MNPFKKYFEKKEPEEAPKEDRGTHADILMNIVMDTILETHPLMINGTMVSVSLGDEFPEIYFAFGDPRPYNSAEQAFANIEEGQALYAVNVRRVR